MDAVRMQGFSFTYPNAPVRTFGPLDWQVAEGSFTLLLGATGCGKTTLLRCLKPALAPAGTQEGALEVLGRVPAAFAAADGAAQVGYVAQNPENQLVCDTVWHELAFGMENMGLDQDAIRRRVAEVAHFFGIEPWFRAPVADLSGGQQQMVNLAAVLVMQPRLLVLDEPTAQLDPVAEKNFLHALFRVNRELGITVIMATHAPEVTAPYATELVELENGRVLPTAAPPILAAVPASAPAVFRPISEVPPAISLRDVRFRYSREDGWVLRGLELDVRAGGVHAIVGGNGCGKSTLLRLAAGVLKPEHGRVVNRLVDRQALMPQNPKALFVCDTVAEELKEWQSGCGYGDDAVDAMLVRFSLAAHAERHPYDLSGGQQQLLAFAKILLTEPDLLLLDEPTKGLDTSTKCVLAGAVRACAHCGAAVVLVTHDLAFASRVADRVTMLFDGEAACTESADEFFAGNLFYRPVPDAFFRIWCEESEESQPDDDAAGRDGGCSALSPGAPPPAEGLVAPGAFPLPSPLERGTR